MLSHLSIRDFAVVAHAELAFGRGMTVVSGETGAGKSLLVDALGFLGGARADAGAVRHGAERAELAAEFSLDDCPAAAAWLRERELDDDDACQLRRILRADGGSRAWINGRPVPLAQLSELAALLVEIHGQHEQQALLSRPHQTRLLDAHARHPALLDAVRATAALESLAAKSAAPCSPAATSATARPGFGTSCRNSTRRPWQPAALAELDASHRRHAHAASLIAACEQALEQLGGDSAIGVQLHQLRGSLQRETAHEPRLAEVDALLDSAAIQLDEGARPARTHPRRPRPGPGYAWRRSNAALAACRTWRASTASRRTRWPIIAMHWRVNSNRSRDADAAPAAHRTRHRPGPRRHGPRPRRR